MQKRTTLRVLAGLLCLVVAALFALPSCSSGCPDGETEVCEEDGTTCVCSAPCTSYKDCDAADPSTTRYCKDFGGGQALCVPAAFFQDHCSDGPCEGACSTTDGSCLTLCRTSSECATGCCFVPADINANPLCPSEPAPPGTSYAGCI